VVSRYENTDAVIRATQPQMVQSNPELDASTDAKTVTKFLLGQQNTVPTFPSRSSGVEGREAPFTDHGRASAVPAD
jgi:hypothetical protein